MEEVKKEVVETTPTPMADDDDTHVGDYEESDGNFDSDSEEDDHDNLLPAGECVGGVCSVWGCGCGVWGVKVQCVYSL